jgi:hypothetical protein
VELLFKAEIELPFGRIPLLLHLREDAFCLVIDAVGALWHLSITLYLLLATHIARL